MAERSTAAVGVTSKNGKARQTGADPSSAEPDRVAYDGDTAQGSDDHPSSGHSTDSADRPGTGPAPASRADDTTEQDSARPEPSPSPSAAPDGKPSGRKEPERTGAASPDPADDSGPPVMRSGRKLAKRYRLEECITRLDGFSSWRAVDEKLRRAVGVHILPSAHPRARSVLRAARSAALLGDVRFVQVLDAVEEGELVYVVHEWLSDASPLSTLLPAEPLDAHEAYQLVSQLSQAMAAAHREGLSHLRLTPAAVLRSSGGQYRIRGLAVDAALRGITSNQPQQADTEAIGALLYAALTQRWPYEEDAYGLVGVPTLVKGGLVPPDQVRAGVHRGLSELAMRALVNDGATASRQEQPCSTPESLAKATAAIPPVRPSEPTFDSSRPFQRPPYGPERHGAPAPAAAVPAPPALPGRTGRVLKWGVSALLIAALGLGSWQLADTLLNNDGATKGSETGQSQQHPDTDKERPGKPIPITEARDFDPFSNGEENSDNVAHAYDGDTSTSWHTKNYYGRADFGGLKRGVGLILDLGTPQQVGSVTVNFVGDTSAELLAAPADATSMPTAFEDFREVARGGGTDLTLQPEQAVTTRYVLVWLTKLPADGDGYRGRVTNIEITT